MDLKIQAKQIARNLLGELRSEASRARHEDLSINEEEYFHKISREFLHSFALEATKIVGWPNGLDIFRNTVPKENNNDRKPIFTEDETKKLN